MNRQLTQQDGGKTQDGRMTKIYVARDCALPVSRDIFIRHSAFLSLTAVQLCKVPNERMVKRRARRHKPPAYKRGDEVLVRYRPDRRRSVTPKRRIVLKGTILKKSKTNSMFNVRINGTTRIKKGD